MAGDVNHPDEILRVGELEITPASGLVVAAGRAVALSVREFELLLALARRRGRILARDELYALVWGSSLRRGDRSVDVYVHKLRGKLESAAPGLRFIHTHVGFGYRLAPEAVETATGRSHGFHNAATAP